MIFVPSKNGLSHSPLEFTPPEALENGANLLLQTLVLLMDRAEEFPKFKD
jgi:N-carbamoyl-L-amino-acid hydrolase